jgi:hypothetical protein
MCPRNPPRRSFFSKENVPAEDIFGEDVALREQVRRDGVSPISPGTKKPPSDRG